MAESQRAELVLWGTKVMMLLPKLGLRGQAVPRVTCQDLECVGSKASWQKTRCSPRAPSDGVSCPYAGQTSHSTQNLYPEIHTETNILSSYHWLSWEKKHLSIFIFLMLLSHPQLFVCMCVYMSVSMSVYLCAL